MTRVVQLRSDLGEAIVPFGVRLDAVVSGLGAITVEDFQLIQYSQGIFQATIAYRAGGGVVNVLGAQAGGDRSFGSINDLNDALAMSTLNRVIAIKSIPPQDNRDIDGRQLLMLYSESILTQQPVTLNRPIYIVAPVGQIAASTSAAADVLNAEGISKGQITVENRGTIDWIAGCPGYAYYDTAAGAWYGYPTCCCVPAPVEVTAPVISGAVYVDQTLTTTDGTWLNSPVSFTYQWYRDGVAIGGATANTYVVTLADEGEPITCEVVATNGYGPSSPAESNELHHWIPSDTLSANVVQHCDAADPSTLTLPVAGRVQTWADKSGNGNDEEAPSDAQRPFYGARFAANGLPVVDFQGAQEMLAAAIANGPVGTALSWFNFGMFDAINDGDIVNLYVAPSPPGGGYRLARISSFAAAIQLVGFVGGSANFKTYVASNLTDEIILSGQLESGDTQMYHDGTLGLTTGDVYENVTGIANALIGDDETGGNELNGFIGEFFWTDDKVDTTDFQKGVAYLAWRWGKTAQLDAGNPWKSTPPPAP